MVLSSRLGTERLPAHLEARYGIAVTGLAELDLGVFRVDRGDGPSWVARLFPAARPVEGAEGDAGVLCFLQRRDFPAERCAHPDPVSVHEGQGVLVTEFAQGAAADGSERTFHTLGDLLGRLHTLPHGSAAAGRDGGAWHHLAHRGGPRAEIDAAMSLLAAAEQRAGGEQRALHAALRGELERAEDCGNLPHALIHPDFVPANAIAAPGGGLLLIDWTGAGRGPRLSSLAFLLWAAGGRTMAHVDAVVAGYGRRVRLEPAELVRLSAAIRARPLVFECWAYCMGRKELPDVVQGLRATRDLAEAIAAQVARVNTGQAGLAGAGVTGHGATGHKASGYGAPGSGAPLEGVGGTGLSVAAIRAEETARPDRLFADPLAGAFVTASGWSPPGRPHSRREAALKVWVVARTVFLDELLGFTCRDGCRQVVVLGAGFDARAFRLPWPPGVRFFEVDTADVLDRKEQVLTAERAVAGCERIPVACDLRDDWPAALLAAGFAPGQPTTWIAEGLVVYLTRDEGDQVVADLTELSAAGSQLGLTMANRDPRAGQEQISRAMVLRRSSAPDDPVRWLAGHGWAAQVTDAIQVLGDHGRPLPGQPALPAEPEHGPPEHGPPEHRRPRAFLVSAVRDAALAQPRSATPAAPAPGPLPSPRGSAAPAGLPLPSLLSQLLVAFTIEFDNEFEHQMPHRTARGPAAHTGGGPWLVSLAMWANFMQFVTEDAVPLGELAGLARITNLPGLERWGYVVVEPDPADRRPRPPRSDWVVRRTAAGQRAQQVWRPLASVIEQRWQARFGADQIGRLTASLQALVSQFSVELPCYLPVRGVSKQDLGARLPAGRPGRAAPRPDLSVLLSQALLMFTTDFERESDLSLAVSANVLRVLSGEGVRVRDLPLRAGVSKEAASLSVGFLERHGYVVVEPAPAAGRIRLARLTPQGSRAQDAYWRLLGVIEERWRAQFGAGTIAALRESLQGLFGQPAGEQPRQSQGLAPYPDGWRAHPPYRTQTTAMTRDPAGTLAHHPMVSHRGGFPDGS